MPASNTDSSTSIPSLAASVGLFLVTTALSQWVQGLRASDDDSEFLVEGSKEFENLKGWYRSRRLHDRLSYGNINNYLGEKGKIEYSARAIAPDHVNNQRNDDKEGTEWERHQRLRRPTLTNALDDALRQSLMEIHPSADYDFHPKNRNWRHFEHFNEEDRQKHLEKMSSSLRRMDDIAEKQEDADSSTCYGDAQSISSEGSGSSEEQFVWMKHHHRNSTILSKENQDGEMSTAANAVGLGTPFQMVKRMLIFKAESSSVEDEEPKVEVNNRTLRAQYNARIMPEKLIMIRHGQSMGNINEELYSTTPDNAMPLTDLGWEQARAAGKILKEKILSPDQTIHFIVSPYVRTVETFHGLASAWCDPKEFSHIKEKEERIKAWYGRLIEMGLTWSEDSRIREQDFGNYQDPETIKRAKKERHKFGVFYYRFPHGESASDVFDRVSTFLDSLWRSFETGRSRNYVLVTHGISIRVLLARYFRYTIDQFNILANPTNCEMVVLGHDGHGNLELEGRSALALEQEPSSNRKKVIGYKFHKRLKILPKSSIHRVPIRISPDE